MGRIITSIDKNCGSCENSQMVKGKLLCAALGNTPVLNGQICPCYTESKEVSEFKTACNNKK